MVARGHVFWALAWFVGVLFGARDAYACLLNLQCPEATPICNTLTQACRGCQSNLECGSILTGYECATSGPLAGQCVPPPAPDAGSTCTMDSQCGAGDVCDSSSSQCVLGCRVSLGVDSCALGTQCSVLGGQIGICLALGSGDAGEASDAGDAGTPSCSTDADCGLDMVCERGMGGLSACIIGCRIGIPAGCPIGLSCTLLDDTGNVGACVVLPTGDAGLSIEAGISLDASLPLDSGLLPDASLLLDAGLPLDAGLQIDTGLPVDAALPDGSLAIDAGISVDASLGLDASVSLDAGEPEDSGVAADAARTADSGAADGEVDGAVDEDVAVMMSGMPDASVTSDDAAGDANQEESGNGGWMAAEGDGGCESAPAGVPNGGTSIWIGMLGVFGIAARRRRK